MTSVHDVAAYILRQSAPMTTMKLQKLCYYSQGWSLAWDGLPLFPETFRAWANGPVCYELFDTHRGRFQVSEWPSGNPDRLTEDQRETVDAVLASYGKLTGQQLSDKTHGERPWVETRDGLADGAGSSREISMDLMQEFFGGLTEAEAV
ncbi:Panacea domain-containing protein [Nocardia sp. BMG111209]|uniref:Panacea domain-containing protein n=1 Tax=Nocardia sp. BMG111209 TaxID=1160137 RepID=UPI000475AA34|nr:type II toxin-antitoxin system antitoxin SocA domain-containing protein [Nocardia sp. BMG111209]